MVVDYCSNKKEKNLSGPTVKLFIIILAGNVCGVWCVCVCGRRRVRYVGVGSASPSRRLIIGGINY